MDSHIRLLRRFKITLVLLLFFALASACASTTAPSASNVTFVIPISLEAFSPSAALQVSVWNAAQLKTLDRQAECVISHDVQTGTESIHCPAGVQYQGITPEEFIFPVQAIKQSVRFTSQAVKTGEKYQIVLRGLSNDDCNSNSATAEGIARSSTITLGKLEWMTTEMACVQP
jgi:hypothetical protein